MNFKAKEIKNNTYYFYKKNSKYNLCFTRNIFRDSYSHRMRFVILNCKTMRENTLKSATPFLVEMPNTIADYMIQRNHINDSNAILIARAVKAHQSKKISDEVYIEYVNKLLDE